MPYKLTSRFRLPKRGEFPRQICPLSAAGEFILAMDGGLWHIDLNHATAMAKFAETPSKHTTLFDPPEILPSSIPPGATPCVAGDFGQFRVLIATSFGNVCGWDLRDGIKPLFDSVHSHPRTLYFDTAISVLYVGCGDYPLDSAQQPHAWLEAWEYREGVFLFAGATMLPGVSLDGIAIHYSEDFYGLVCFSGHRSQRLGYVSVVDRLNLRVLQQVEVPLAMIQSLAAKDDRVFLGADAGLLAVSLTGESILWHEGQKGAQFSFDGDQSLFLSTGEVISTGKGKILERFDARAKCSRLQFDSDSTLIGVGDGEIFVWRETPIAANTFSVFVADNYHYMDPDETYKLGEFATWDKAVEAAMRVVDRCLADDLKPGMTAEGLYSTYTSFGDDPHIVPQPDGKRFSAWEYAKKRCQELCRNAQ